MALQLSELDEETWGERVRRARERAGLTLRQAAQLVGEVHPTSFRSIARLEEEKRPPAARRQLTAYITLLGYGYDPDAFGLADTPASTLVDRDEVATKLSLARQRILSAGSESAWHRRGAGRHLYSVAA
jgi:transcriptional regulator with XRE-family HTH domain